VPLGCSLIYTYKQDVTDLSGVLLSCFEVGFLTLLLAKIQVGFWLSCFEVGFLALLAKVGLGIIYEVAIVLGKIYFQKSLTFLDIWCN
jgi:hypothetical protein